VTAAYPGSLPALVRPSHEDPANDGSSTDATVIIDAIADELEAIAAELGTTPSGAAATVRARLDAMTTQLDGVTTNLADTITGPLYIAHRGGGAGMLEHAWESYRAAAEAGFAIEADVHVLSDGTLVSIHDTTVNRTMNGTGAVSSLTRAQWRALQVKPLVNTNAEHKGAAYGTPVEWSRLADVYGGRVLLVVEAKASAAVAPLIADIVARGLQRSVIFQSFTFADAQAAAAAGICSLWLSDSATPSAVAAAGIEWVGVSTSATSGYISSLKAAGRKVAVYTVNSRSAAATFLGYGVDAIFSDDPEFVAGLPTRASVDPFAARRQWPGWYPSGSVAPAYSSFGRAGEFGVSLPGDGSAGCISHRWAGKHGPYMRIRWRVRYFPAQSTDLTRWGGSLFVGTVGNEDAGFIDAAQAGNNGYHAFIRRSGSMGLFRVDNGVATQLATNAGGGTIAAYNAEGYVDLELLIDASGVTFTDLTRSQVLTSADTTHRSAAAVLYSRWNQNAAYQSGFSIEDL
jgi:glycerophosphoryl diester phosphodiesterase